MSNLFASRKGPLMIAAGICGGLLYTTYGGTQQPRPRQQQGGAGLSEALQGAAGQGGARARGGEETEALRRYDPKDTRLYSADPTAQSKRNPNKARSDDLSGDGTSPGAGLGKHIGDRSEGQTGDLAWKRTGS
ncbi:hypothetical protein VTH82DRAFT_6975 [Thermothelomyces myriococcoides]